MAEFRAEGHDHLVRICDGLLVWGHAVDGGPFLLLRRSDLSDERGDEVSDEGT